MKLIVTSATMDAQKFADFFGNVPTFQVSVVMFYLCFIITCPAKPKLPTLLVGEIVLAVGKILIFVRLIMNSYCFRFLS